MAAPLFNIQILTPQRSVFSGLVVSLIAPGALGQLGVLAHHAPLLTKLVAGKIILKRETAETLVFESRGNGFLEVHKNQVTLLADAVE